MGMSSFLHERQRTTSGPGRRETPVAGGSLFARIVAAGEDSRLAIVGPDGTLSYTELIDRSRRLASHLLRLRRVQRVRHRRRPFLWHPRAGELQRPVSEPQLRRDMGPLAHEPLLVAARSRVHALHAERHA